jgi:purine-nucleoside phosphorylase
MLISDKALDFIRNYEKKVQEASDYIKSRFSKQNKNPEWAITLGSGLGDLSNQFKDKIEIPYKDIPNFPITTVQSHEGTLILGKLEGKSVIGLKGRTHYYEVANDPDRAGILEVVFPIHVLANLGIKNYFVTNAVGGLNLDYEVGDLMVIKSHMNMCGVPNPLAGRLMNFKTVHGKPVGRFVPMNSAYNPELSKKLLKAGEKFQKNMHQGVYVVFPGPSFETEAECIASRKLGADVVGMSLSPEVAVARQRGMNVVALSCVSNKIKEDGTNATTNEEVSKILKSPEIKTRIETVVKNFFKSI